MIVEESRGRDELTVSKRMVKKNASFVATFLLKTQYAVVQRLQ